VERLEERTEVAARESLLVFIGFGYLQILDLLTTLAFLFRGIAEANPVVRWTILLAGNPLHGLLYAKLIALVLGFFCWKWNRRTLLSWATLAYAVLVAWNLTALVLAGLGVR
jgi:hypothetical protein